MAGIILEQPPKQNSSEIQREQWIHKLWLYVTQWAIPAGSVIETYRTTAPDGWLMCDGSAVSRTEYKRLFDAIGTIGGVGDGSTTFNVPDKRGRASIGAGTGSGLTARTLGATGGAETHTLTTAEMPAHTHTQRGNTIYAATGAAGAANLQNLTDQGPTGSTGGGGAHNNMQPFLVANFMIKT